MILTCAQPGCLEEVEFGPVSDVAVKQDRAKYRGKCRAGHVNLLTPDDRRQWIEDDAALA